MRKPQIMRSAVTSASRRNRASIAGSPVLSIHQPQNVVHRTCPPKVLQVVVRMGGRGGFRALIV